MTHAICDVMQCGLVNVTDVSEELVPFFFMVWLVKETVQTVKKEAKAPQTTYRAIKYCS